LSRSRFRETFEQANVKLAEVFPRLFPGGRAELVLTETEEGGESGVEIIVQPVGKKLGSLSLLSGGEKAMTAVALILSLFMVRPTPFCVLDEVDAPLDDANVGRFDHLIREISLTSQFVLITHNKRTMEAADTLYGITMQEAGVSKVVSVRLKQAA
jgi:chromosome segregation protein